MRFDRALGWRVRGCLKLRGLHRQVRNGSDVILAVPASDPRAIDVVTSGWVRMTSLVRLGEVTMKL